MAGAQGPPEALTRRAQKERTRQAILAATLRLSEETGLAAVSLRQVAKEVGIVPTGFYRHFGSVEEVGLALVVDSFVSLRAMLRDVRREPALIGVIEGSVSVLRDHVRRREEHFRFIARERNGGSPAVRRAIADELDALGRELAADIGRLPGTDVWSDGDVAILSDLIVSAMVGTTERILESGPGEEADVLRVAETQLRMLVVGALNWRSRPDD